jgi:hypothetical protein
MITPLCMRTSAPFCALLAVALLTGAGCDEATARLPAAPVAAPAPPPAPVIPEGEIAVLSVQPGAGATLTAEECDGGWCVLDLSLAVDVRLNQAVAEPWVTVSFNDGSQPCAISGYPTIFQTLEPLPADAATRFAVSTVVLSHPTGGTLCRLPQTTDKLVVQLWAERGRSSSPLLTREFAHSYTFVLP